MIAMEVARNNDHVYTLGNYCAGAMMFCFSRVREGNMLCCTSHEGNDTGRRRVGKLIIRKLRGKRLRNEI